MAEKLQSFGIFCQNLEMKSPKARTGTAQSQRPLKNRLFEFSARGLRRSRVRARTIRAKEKVRVIGWLTWDQEHAADLGKCRRTLWEVHPIHQIQVQRGNQWIKL
jgi:hypothetical protein